MRRFSGHGFGVDRGSVGLFSDFEDGGPMWTGEGMREVRHRVDFAEPFRGPPVVHVSLTMWDMDSAPNARADLRADAVDAAGFTLAFRTWGDSRIARARADWLALGEVGAADDWQV